MARSVALLVCLSALSASAAAAAPGLEQLLQLGSDDAQGSVTWGVSLTEIQQVYAGSAGSTSSDAVPGLLFVTTVADVGCEYKVYFYRGSDSDRLTGVRLEHAAGPLAECRARIEQLLQRMYGTPSTTRTEAGWRRVTSNGTSSGPIVFSSWQTKAACIKLAAKEGAGYPGSPLAVTLGDLRGGCGYDDEVVRVRPRP